MIIHSLGTLVFIRDTVRSFPQEDGSIVILGEVVNHSQGPAKEVKVIASATDEICDLLAVEEKTIGYLFPDQRYPFKLVLRPFEGEVLELHLYLAHAPIGVKCQPSEVLNTSCVPSQEPANNEGADISA